MWFCGVMYISGLCGGLLFRLVNDGVVCTLKYLESELTAARTFSMNFSHMQRRMKCRICL